MLPLIPIIIISGVGYLWHKKKAHGMTPERKKIYEEAMRSLQDPEKLRALAVQYQAFGLPDEATDLRNRANLRALPNDQKKARRDAFTKSMASNDPEKMEQAAAIFHSQGATSNAAALRKKAAAVKQVKSA
jgi:hypothetical protein